MKIKEFTLERIQSLYENTVEFNLSDSGVHPYSLNQILSKEQILEFTELELGYGWTNGGVALRKNIASLYQGRTSDNIIVTNGSAEANFLMVMALLNPEDELIVFVPNYLQIWGWAKALGITVQEIPLCEDKDWAPDLEKLENVISDKTKMMTICHPNNPTGAVLSREAMETLVKFTQKHDIYLHSDEVYKGAELNGTEPPSFADLYDKAIVTSGLSKAMAMPGLRLGWLVGPVEDIAAAWACKDYTSITTSALSEYIANIVLQPDMRKEILGRSKELLQHHLDLLTLWVKRNSDWVSFIPPKSGGMAFIKYDLPINSTDLVHRFREELSVFLLPGDVYGMDGYFRVGIGAPYDHIDLGLKRIEDYVRKNIL